MRSKGEGQYSCSYTPTSALKHTVAVAWGGVSIPGSPFRVSSDPSPPAGEPWENTAKAKKPVIIVTHTEEGRRFLVRPSAGAQNLSDANPQKCATVMP